MCYALLSLLRGGLYQVALTLERVVDASTK